MKLPEPAPNWRDVLARNPEKLPSLLTSREARACVEKANLDYLHWEKAKYLNVPASISPEELWCLVKLSRTPNIKSLPLLDTQGRPFGFWLPDPVLKELHFIDQNAGGSILVDNPELSSEARERYLISSLMEEAIASSQIEGAATTRKVAKEMLREGRPPTNKAEKMILNNYQTIRKIKSFLGQPSRSISFMHSMDPLQKEHWTIPPRQVDSGPGRIRSSLWTKATDKLCMCHHPPGNFPNGWKSSWRLPTTRTPNPSFIR